MRTQARYGLLAEFDRPAVLLQAAQAAQVDGYTRMEAYSPFPIEGLAEAVGFRRNMLPWLVLAGGFGGAGAGYSMMYYATVINYPLNVAGRPLNSWPSYIPITFELGVLFASLTAVISLLALCGLPEPYHPIFHADNFERQAEGRFFLCIRVDDPKFDFRETWQYLSRHGATRLSEVEGWRSEREREAPYES